ncbi:hypothetical protein BDP81DRAFT_118819 [Colletotrichum phormii]|uniref:Secreted protein n=1 Tax=Colletotrichum phormii TaxID=359342 RepID=A0AAI9ZHJ4_9PEZI|nr:uncharacterized protein BDP81DRAFT_118819 [Colletotrichum phormii]KAK1623526.1 hypothetical protein BDP81DRAFT_118819 [Colletotrichum phormii]
MIFFFSDWLWAVMAGQSEPVSSDQSVQAEQPARTIDTRCVRAGSRPWVEFSAVGIAQIPYEYLDVGGHGSLSANDELRTVPRNSRSNLAMSALVRVPVVSLTGDEAAATPVSTEQQAEGQAWTRCVWSLRAGDGGFGLPLEWAFDPGQ